MKFSTALLQNIKDNDPKLISLDLSFCDINDSDTEKIADALKTNTTLTELYSLNCSQLTDASFTSLITALRDNHQIKKIHLVHHYINIVGVQALSFLLDGNLRLIDLSLHLSRIPENIAVELFHALHTNDVLRTFTLYVGYNGIGQEGIHVLKKMLQRNQALMVLNLSSNNIDDLGGEYLNEALLFNQTLTTLNLNYNSMGERSARALGDVLRCNQTLVELNLSGNHIGDIGLDLLSCGLAANRSLRILDLAQNKIGGNGAKALSQALKVNQSLSKLDLSGNNIGIVGTEALSAALMEDGNQTLTVLYLNCNDIGDHGVIALTQMLLTNKVLSVLTLYDNSIGDLGADALGQLLQTQSPLIELNLGGNFIGNGGALSLVKGLQANQRLTEFRYSTKHYTKKLTFDILAPFIKTLLHSNYSLVRFSIEGERERFNEISLSAIQNNQQRARNLLEAILQKNTRKAIKLLDQGVNPFVIDWQCGFAPYSHNMALHWIALTGNVRLMCEIIARYKYFIHYRNELGQSVLDIINVEQQKNLLKYEYVWFNMRQLCLLNRERSYRILALTRILYQSVKSSRQFNLFTELPLDLQSKILGYLVGGEVSTGIFANITDYAKEKRTIWNNPSQFIRYCLWGGVTRWYQDEYSNWDISLRQRYYFIETLLMTATLPFEKRTFTELLTLLNRCQSLTKLNLSKQAFKRYQTYDVSLITPRCSHQQVVNLMLQLLKKKTPLERVYLGNVLMTRQLIETLADVLKKNTTLTKIVINGFDYIPICQKLNKKNVNLSQQNIGSEQGNVIAIILATKHHIRHLNLSGNVLNSESLKNILWALKDNTNLQSIDLRFSWIDEKCAMVLWHLLQENRYIQEVNIDFDQISKHLKRYIADELRERQSSSSYFAFFKEKSRIIGKNFYNNNSDNSRVCHQLNS